MAIRAKKGGEYGANGEWYDGGKFINTVAKNAKGSGGKRSGTKMVLVEAGQLVPAIDGMRAIYQCYRDLWRFDADGNAAVIPTLPVAVWGEEYLQEVAEMAKRFNRGERWIPA